MNDHTVHAESARPVPPIDATLPKTEESSVVTEQKVDGDSKVDAIAAVIVVVAVASLMIMWVSGQ